MKRNQFVKKFLSVILCFATLLGVCLVLTGCKKGTSIEEASKNLSSYSLTLDFDDSSKILSGLETLNYKNPTDTTLKTLEFHLYPNAFRGDAKYRPVSALTQEKAYPNGFSEGKIDIKSVAVNGQNVQVNIGGNDKNMLVVPLSEELFPNDNVTIQIEFASLLPNCNHRYGYGENTYNFGNFYPVVAKYEQGDFKRDNYGANGDPFYSDMANYSVSITHDSDFTLASTGNQQSQTSNNGKTTTNISASAVRDFGFVLSKKFTVISQKTGKTTVKYYYYDDEKAQESLQAGIDAIATFNNLFGEYPYESYSIVKTNFVHGGMEYPNLVYISDAYETHEDYVNVIVHETAHQWWYNLVGSNACEYAWMDEGLTEFSTLLFYRHNSAKYPKDTRESLNASLSSFLLFSDICKSVYGKFDCSMSRNVNDFASDMEYTYITYVEGVLFFDNLEENVGEKNFLKALKQYFKQNEFKIATPEDMISAFEIVTKRDMQTFFNSWTQGKVILQQCK